MQSIIEKNDKGETIKTTTGQKNVQEETAKFWEKMFANENIETTEEDIYEYLGNTAGQEAKKVNEKEREEMDKEITLDDIEETIRNLKNDKSPGVTGFTNEFYKEFHNDLNIWILDYIKFTKEKKNIIIHAKKGINNTNTKRTKR